MSGSYKCLLLALIYITAGITLIFVQLTSNENRSKLNYIKRKNEKVTLERWRVGNRTVADKLWHKVRVLCWVMTQPKNHDARAQHVKATWGRHCNILLFMSSKSDPSLPAIKLPIGEGRNNLWGKTKAAFRYVYEYHRRDADWFLKADDDTYVVVENLRYMLEIYNPKSPIYFGCRYRPFTPQGFMSGGAGYVLSSEALDRFIHKALPTPHLCKSYDNTGAEDAEIGKCLNNVGVQAMDSRDEMHKGRFFPFNPADHLLADPNVDFWYWKYMYYKTKEGLNCCSNHVITFHYVPPKDMYLYEYLIYHLRPYGIKFGAGKLGEIRRTDKKKDGSKFGGRKVREIRRTNKKKDGSKFGGRKVREIRRTNKKKDGRH